MNTFKQSPNGKTALLIGATGLAGRELLKLLLEDEQYAEVRVFARRSTGLQNPKLKEYLLDFADLEAHSTEISGQDLFICMGITLKKAGSIAAAYEVEVNYPRRFAEIALKNGLSQVLVITSVGAKPSSKNYYLKAKGHLEEQLKELLPEALHIFRPSLLLGDRREVRIGEDIAKVLGLAFDFFIPPRYKAIKAKTVAKYMQLIAKKAQKGLHVHESERIRRVENRFFDMQKFEERTEYKEEV